MKNNASGIVLYGLTPPKINTDTQKVKQIAQKQLQRLENIDIDGLVLYDLQDESNRTSLKRTFEFCKNISPEVYHKDFLKEKYPAVIYKAAGNYTKEEFSNFCKNTSDDTLSVFVGTSSSADNPKLTLNEAYKIKKQFNPNITIGGICIPERHEKKKDEELRLASKIFKGCEFFITQTVYNIENAKKLIDDYVSLEIKKVPIIFTFTPCGSKKTLDFMRWLGICMPPYFEQRLFEHEDPLQKSVDLSLDLFEFLYKYGKAKGVSIGANVESISTRKVEIDASIELLKGIKKLCDDERDCSFREVLQSASKGFE